MLLTLSLSALIGARKLSLTLFAAALTFAHRAAPSPLSMVCSILRMAAYICGSDWIIPFAKLNTSLPAAMMMSGIFAAIPCRSGPTSCPAFVPSSPAFDMMPCRSCEPRFFATSHIFGASSAIFAAIPSMPAAMSSTPLMSPANSLPSPSVSCVAAGKNSAIMRFFNPVMVMVIVVTESWNAAEALTAASGITMPYFSAISICSSMAAVPPLNRGPSSVAPRPSSFEARAIRSVSFSIADSLLTVSVNS